MAIGRVSVRENSTAAYTRNVSVKLNPCLYKYASVNMEHISQPIARNP